MSGVNRQASGSLRLKLLSAALSLAFMVIGARLVWLHVFETHHLRDLGNEVTIRYEKTLAYRGIITDRLGEPLAISTPVAAVAIRPSQLSDADWARKLAPWLQTTQQRLETRKAGSTAPFIYLSRYVTPEDAAQIEAMNLAGVEVSPLFRRFYPAGEVAAHLVGFTNIEDQGQEGFEYAFDTWLSGTDGLRHILKNRRANVVRYVSAGQEVRSGRDLRLSVDLRLQYLTHRALKEAVARSRAVSGSAVLLDAWTGEVLAMSSQPAFNPNDMSARIPGRVRNRAILDLIEPGSLIKPFTIATALDLGVISANQIIDTSPGRMRVGGAVINDVSNYGELDVSSVLAKSSNIGTVKIEQQMPSTALRDRLAQLGLGQSTGTGFPGEVPGLLPNEAVLSQIERATLSYGYGMQSSVLQLAQAYSVFANDGLFQPVTLLAEGATPKPVRVYRSETVQQLLPMLEAATVEGGTARQAQIPLYRVGGKTGTSMKPVSGSYVSQEYVASFVGLAPMSNPRFVMAVVIDDPRSQQYFGGQVAAPVFADVMDDVMRIYNISPDLLDRRLLAGGQP